MDEYKPDVMLLQETCMHQIEETTIANKLGTDRIFVLNSPDQFCEDFNDKLQTSTEKPIHGTGVILNTEICGKKFQTYEPTTARIQHIRLENNNYINIYFPTVDYSADGREKLEEALGDLDLILEPLRGEAVAVAGDFNLSDAHKPGEKMLFICYLLNMG